MASCSRNKTPSSASKGCRKRCCALTICVRASKPEKFICHTHIFQSRRWGGAGGDFWWEASVAVLNPKYLGNNLTYSLYLKYDLAHPAISNQGLEDVFFGGWPLNKLWGFSLLYPGEKSQAIEAGEESSQNIRSHLIQGLGENCFKNSISIMVAWIWWRDDGKRLPMLIKDPFYSLILLRTCEKQVQDKIHTCQGEPTIKLSAEGRSAMWESWASQPHRPGRGPQLRHLLAGWTWAGFPTSSSLCFLLWKMEATPPSSPGSYLNKWMLDRKCLADYVMLRKSSIHVFPSWLPFILGGRNKLSLGYSGDFKLTNRGGNDLYASSSSASTSYVTRGKSLNLCHVCFLTCKLRMRLKFTHTCKFE